MSTIILVIADLHGAYSARQFAYRNIELYKPEIVVVAGDITNFGPSEWAREFVNDISTKASTTIAIPGNCDTPNVAEELECSDCIALHSKKINIGNLVFVGFGGSNITPFNTPLEFSEYYIYDSLHKIVEIGCILITHCPAKGTLDYISGKGNLGSESIAKIVEEYKPKLHISAHIHEARGIVKKDNTLHLNPGQASKGCAALVRIDDKIYAELL